MTDHKELELKEKEKYNYFVTKKGYGSDYKRTKQIERIQNSLGDVSVAFKNILSELKEGGEFKVLDIGSGPGGVMNWLKEECGAEVYGIDISEEFVKKSKEHFPSLENVYVANANNINMFKNNTFDLVCHLDGMEHIPKVWEKSCLKEAVRVSKKYIFYETACAGAVADIWSRERGFTAAHINVKKPSEWSEFFKQYSDEFNYDIIFSHIGMHHSVILRKR